MKLMYIIVLKGNNNIIMSDYIIIKNSIDNDIVFDVLVISTTNQSLLNRLDELEDTFNKNGIINASVIFDMLLSYGNNYQRFFTIEYINNKFNIKSFNNIILEKKDKIRKLSAEILSKNSKLIMNSALNSVQKQALKSGYII